MKILVLHIAVLLVFFINGFVLNAQETPGYVIAIHGGAGYSNPETMSEEIQNAYHAALKEALEAGARILENGGTALDAVERAIVILEDNPIFNAGRGAVQTANKNHELDASIMDGSDRNAGAVAGVTTVKNPILAARLVMEQTPHVKLSGTGADEFAVQHQLEIVPNRYFDRNYQPKPETENPHGGTVGAVALDLHGNLAAGTSTGGMTNKMKGRLGDSPIIGAGTFAENATCAVSCTGHGEYFIRYAVAYDVHARMAYLGETLDEAAANALESARAAGGTGGLIAVDRNGHVTLPYNTGSMFRGVARAGGLETAIFSSETE